MTDPMWKKAGQTDTDASVMQFLAAADIELDRELIGHDICASMAHVRGLARIDLLSEEDAVSLVASLQALQQAIDNGEFVLDQRFEDGHSAIEHWLTEKLGDLGARVHAGRSRNDQIAVAMRLYLKQQLLLLGQLCADIAAVCLQRAASEADVVMPGHTHLQQAMPSSLGLWWAGHAEAFVDNTALALHTRDWLDACPLGTASGFGVNLPLDRDGVAAELGFARLLVNPQYAQNARGKVELRALDALHAASSDMRRLSWDLSLFTTSEFNIVELPASYCTGSSIMPNKHNPDTVELLRAAHATVAAARVEIDALLSLPSGYQRDLQNSKAPTLRAFAHTLPALRLLPELLHGLHWNQARMRELITPAMHATDRANELVASGQSFRSAYRQVATELEQMADRQAEDSLRARISPGGCAQLELGRIGDRLDHLSDQLQAATSAQSVYSNIQ